ncbi:hypothetical protein L4D06_08155 [Enterovibrio makurazakiensis]|uniref:hypothetical protein n=1 Tax=Enterovibrio makurazakiensis TaxID=2910232 RepID=UPI003D258CE6
MTLSDVIKNIASIDADMTIYAKTPWLEDSPAFVDYEPDDGSVPDGAENMEYFLEVFIVNQLLEDIGNIDCQRIIDYAINDA